MNNIIFFFATANLTGLEKLFRKIVLPHRARWLLTTLWTSFASWYFDPRQVFSLFSYFFFFLYEGAARGKDVTTILTLTRTTSYKCTPTWKGLQKNRDNSFIGSSAIRAVIIACLVSERVILISRSNDDSSSSMSMCSSRTRNQFYSPRIRLWSSLGCVYGCTLYYILYNFYSFIFFSLQNPVLLDRARVFLSTVKGNGEKKRERVFNLYLVFFLANRTTVFPCVCVSL